jgi:hypothetical protein
MGRAAGEWWEDPQATWTSGVPGKVAELLARAYGHDDAIRRIAKLGGLDEDAAPTGTPPGNSWHRVLAMAADQQRVLDVVLARQGRQRGTGRLRMQWHASWHMRLPVQQRRRHEYDCGPPVLGIVVHQVR